MVIVWELLWQWFALQQYHWKEYSESQDHNDNILTYDENNYYELLSYCENDMIFIN